MNNVQVADLISNECKKKNIKIALLLQDCGINHSFISDIRHKNRAPSIDKISAIADYLDVSVDYLLGRTDEPQTIEGHSIKIEDIHGDHSANVNIGETIDKDTLEITQMIKKLSVVQKAEIILKINEMLNQK